MINRIVVAVAFVIVLAFAGYESYAAYQWKQVANLRGWRADQCFGWLAEPITPEGVSRAAVLDALAKQAVRK